MSRSDVHHRWLTSREALACQGMPILKEFSHGVALCTWAADEYEEDIFDPDQLGALQGISADENRTSRIGQAGNAMHTECVGTAIAWILCHCGSDVATILKSKSRGSLLKASADDAQPCATHSGGSRMSRMSRMTRRIKDRQLQDHLCCRGTLRAWPE